MGLLDDADDSFGLTVGSTATRGASFNSGAAAHSTSLPCTIRDQQQQAPIRSDDSSVSTKNTDTFQNNNDAKDQDERHDDDDEEKDYSLQDAQTRISHALPQASKDAHALFGDTVGPCWGDYACTHHRIPGRFYATSHAILFYTNFLLGFERRVCLLLKDVVEMQLVRTTSIRIQTMDMETYIFKSFSDRERVLHLLNGLKILADQNNSATKNNQQQHLAADADARPRNAAARVQSSLYHRHSNNNSTGRIHPPPPRAGIANSHHRINNNNSNNAAIRRTPATTTSAATPASALFPKSTIRVSSSLSSLTGGGTFSNMGPRLSSASISRSSHGIPPPQPPPPLFPLLSCGGGGNSRRRAMSDSIVRRRSNSSILSIEEEEHPIPLTVPPLDHSCMNFNDDMIAAGGGGAGGGDSSVVGDFDSSFVQDGDNHDNQASNNLINDTSCQSFYDDDEDHNMLQQQQHQHALETSWESAKQSNPTPTGEPLQEVGIDSITLSPCSLQDFFHYFLCDTAKYSLDRYQREYIKDFKVHISNWEEQQQQQHDHDDAISTSFQRTMTFTHPINNNGSSSNTIGTGSTSTSSSWSSSFSSMMGPSAAQTTRHQHLQCFAGYGLVLTNKTIVQGIPSCDSFYVQDKWIVEVVGHRPPTSAASAATQQPPSQLKLSVRFEPHFTKRSLLKPIIQNSVRKETNDWMAGYLEMLQRAIKELAVDDAISSATPTKSMARTTTSRNDHECNDTDAIAVRPMAAATADTAVVTPSTAGVVSTANDRAHQQRRYQQQDDYDVLVFAKSVQRLVALAIVLVLLLGVLLLFQLVAFQATLSTLQLQVQGVYVQNAMVMYQLQRQLLAIQLQQINVPAQSS
jgi:VAD1 Analog of StAR-related lipid transfer domain